MPRKSDDSKVIKRLKNGACVMKRICNQCRKGFTGERNICPQCRNDRRRAEGKFGADYHNHYYHRYLSKMAMLHDAGTLSRNRRFGKAQPRFCHAEEGTGQTGGFRRHVIYLGKCTI